MAKETEPDVGHPAMQRVLLYSGHGGDGNNAFGEKINQAVFEAGEFFRRGMK